MLWVDKYRPKTLDQAIVHQDSAQNPNKLVQLYPSLVDFNSQFLRFHNPNFFLCRLQSRIAPICFFMALPAPARKPSSSPSSVRFSVPAPISDAGFQDRYIVQEIMKEMAKNRPIDTKGKKVYKILVLNEVDKLSREAQHSLRRTMEKYSAYCRLILCSNSSSKVTETIRSQCLNVRINAPTEDQIVKVLEFIGKKEALQLPSGFAARIAEKSNRSLSRAILSLETCCVQQYPLTSNQAIPPLDWEEYVSEIASDIMKEQSPKRLYQVRQKLYELLLHCIPPEIILKRLLYELLKKLDAELKHEVCHWAA